MGPPNAPRTPSSAYSICLRVESENRPGWLGRIATAIGDAGGNIAGLEIVEVKPGETLTGQLKRLAAV